MKNIREHIKLSQYKSVYLIYGTEDYLKKLYRDKLRNGILNGEDEMNYSHYEGKGIDISKVIEMAETLPFFSERRLIVIENSGLFKVQNDLADYIKEIPETTHIVFVESEVDKRNRLFKTIKDKGTISEMNGLDAQNLKLWIVGILRDDNKKITNDTLEYFIGKTGTDMDNIRNELEKLICYAYDQDVITIEDIDAVSVTQVTSKIFNMVDAIASKKQTMALDLYYDLLTLKERPMTILFLITRQFNIILQVNELRRLGYNNSVIAQKAGIPPFTVGKYISQGKNFTVEILRGALEYSVEIEHMVKTGRINEKMGVELLIVKYSSNSDDVNVKG